MRSPNWQLSDDVACSPTQEKSWPHALRISSEYLVSSLWLRTIDFALYPTLLLARFSAVANWVVYCNLHSPISQWASHTILPFNVLERCFWEEAEQSSTNLKTWESNWWDAFPRLEPSSQKHPSNSIRDLLVKIVHVEEWPYHFRVWYDHQLSSKINLFLHLFYH